MQRIRNMKIGVRLAVTFSIIFVLFVAAVTVSVRVDHTMSEIMDGFYRKQFRIVVDTRTINGNIEGICRNLLYGITSEDREAAIQSVNEAQTHADRVSQSLLELEGLYTEEPALLDELKRNYQELPLYRQEISLLLLEGDYDEARRIYIEHYSPRAESTRHYALEIFARAEDDAAEYIERSNRNSESLMTGIVIISVIMGLFVIVMGIVIVRSITGPVQEIKTATEGYAHGDLNLAITYKAKDELGELADSIRHSARALSGYIDEIDDCLTALGKGDFDYRIEDIFEGDFAKIRASMTTIAELLRAQKKRDEKTMAALEKAYDTAAYASQAKSDFLSRMSHDIRTPMNAITGMTAIALANLDDQQKVKSCLEKVAVSGKHLLGLINDILDMSKIESGKMTLNNDNMSLAEIMDNVTTITQPQIKAKKQQFNIRLHNVQHERLHGDALRLNQVFINILSNAVKFTPFGGEIVMDIEEVPSRKVEHAHFVFRVTDTGIGMKPEFLKEIFTPFSRDENEHTSKTEGTGLGMAIVKRIVDMMEGEISVESTENVGTTFIIDLHLMLADVPEAEMKLPGVRVLVVDDDRISSETIARTIDEMGVEGDWAESGIAAIEKVMAAKRAGRDYHAVITDYRMPDMNGIQVARAIREKVGPEMPILIISAYDWTDIEDEARSSGVNGFMTKPLFQSTLYAAIRRFVLDKDGPAEQDAPRTEFPDYSGKRILLVEDNEINREVAVELLKATNMDIECAANGVEAVTMFSEAEEGHYDLILMDIQMPLMDGYEATRQIRALYRTDAKTVPIMAMTANAFAEDIEMAHASGMDYHLAKPLDLALLMRRLRKLFG